MAVLNLCLVCKFDESAAMFGADRKAATTAVLIDYFKPALAKTALSDVACNWTPAKSDVTAFSLVAYLLPAQSGSVIKSLNPPRLGALGGSGTTLQMSDNTVLSEVYMLSLRGNDPRGYLDAKPHVLLANLLFHEWLHNLLDATQPALKDVHKIGAGIGRDTDASPLSSNAARIATDTAAMQLGLGRKAKVAQFTASI